MESGAEQELTKQHFGVILGVDVDASADDVDAAWRDWQQSNSPDAVRRDGGSDAEIAEASKRASDVNRARQVLKGERPLKEHDSLNGDWNLDIETERAQRNTGQSERSRSNHGTASDGESESRESSDDTASGFTGDSTTRTRDRAENITEDQSTRSHSQQTDQSTSSSAESDPWTVTDVFKFILGLPFDLAFFAFGFVLGIVGAFGPWVLIVLSFKLMLMIWSSNIFGLSGDMNVLVTIGILVADVILLFVGFATYDWVTD